MPKLNSTRDPLAIRRDLRNVEARISAADAQAREQLDKLEGQRDNLLGELLDLDGAHDRRPVAVR